MITKIIPFSSQNSTHSSSTIEIPASSPLHSCTPSKAPSPTASSVNSDMRSTSKQHLSFNDRMERKLQQRAQNRRLRLDSIAAKKQQIDRMPEGELKQSLLKLHDSLMKTESVVKNCRQLKWWSGTSTNPLSVFVGIFSLIGQLTAEGISSGLEGKLNKQLP